MITGKYTQIFILLLIIIHIFSYFDLGERILVNSASFIHNGSMEDPFFRSYHFSVIYESVSSTKAPNDESHLDIPTYKSKDCHDAVHPDIVDFGNGSTWNGYRYWMAMTPYPGSDDRYENPSIVVSNDRTDWKEPSGILNPIDKASSPKYNSDTELLYEPDMDRLVCYWRNVDGKNTSAYYSYTDDGVNWTSRYECYRGPCLSPSVIRLSKDNYQIYVVHKGTFRRYTSEYPMAGIWNDTDPVTCNLSWLPSNTGVWHAKIRYDFQHQMYLAAFMTVKKGTVDPTGPLYFAYSTDGENFTVQQNPALMEINTKGWDRDFIYRSTFWLSGDTLHIWYSARGGGCRGTWGIGYTSSNLSWGSKQYQEGPPKTRYRFLNITQVGKTYPGPGSSLVINNSDAGNYGSWDYMRGIRRGSGDDGSDTENFSNREPASPYNRMINYSSNDGIYKVVNDTWIHVVSNLIRKTDWSSIDRNVGRYDPLLPQGKGVLDNDDPKQSGANITPFDRDGGLDHYDHLNELTPKIDIILGPFTNTNGDPLSGIVLVFEHGSEFLASVTNEFGYILLFQISPGEYPGTIYCGDQIYKFNMTLWEDGSVTQDMPVFDLTEIQDKHSEKQGSMIFLGILLLILFSVYGLLILIK